MKTNLIYLLLAFSLVFTACEKDEENQPNPSPNPSYTSVDEFITDMEFVGSAFVRRGDEVLLNQGYGLADENHGTPNSPELIYRLGSISKQFTAVAIMHLKRDGLIESYDQNISDFYDGFPEGDRITLRDLLRHHSGISDYSGPVENFIAQTGSTVSKEDILNAITKEILENGLLFEPGEQFSYSNSNYFLLGMLVEHLTSMEFEEYLNQKIFVPLAMKNTGVGQDQITLPIHVRGYDSFGEVEPYPMQVAFSAGFLESNIHDLEIWGDALMGNFLTTSEKAEMFAPPFSNPEVSTVGFGWFTGTINGRAFHYHRGNIDGFSALIGLFRDSNSIIILLSNHEDETEQLSTILRIIAKNEF